MVYASSVISLAVASTSYSLLYISVLLRYCYSLLRCVIMNGKAMRSAAQRSFANGIYHASKSLPLMRSPRVGVEVVKTFSIVLCSVFDVRCLSKPLPCVAGAVCWCYAMFARFATLKHLYSHFSVS